MLRGLVLLFVVVNVALYFWIGADPRWGQTDREPDRLRRQVAPEAIRVLPDLPDLPASAEGAAGGEAASGASSAER